MKKSLSTLLGCFSLILFIGCQQKAGKDPVPVKTPDKIFVRLKWLHQAQFAGFLALSLMVLVTASCQRTSVSKPEVTEPVKVAVQLKWVHQAQFAGFYVALDEGHYTEENLDVTLVEGGPGIDIIKEVASGNAQFGVTSPEHILKARDKGIPVKAVATIFRRYPTVFIAPKGSGINHPGDFIGKKAAVLGADSNIILKVMMEKMGLDFDSVEFTEYKRDYSTLVSGQVDFTSGYATSGLIRLRNRGFEVNTIYPDDYGIHLYADTIITTEEMIRARPEVVRSFVRASLQGWRMSIENPEKATELTMTRARDSDRDLQYQMMLASIPFIHTGIGNIGDMERDKWQGIHDMMIIDKVIKPVEDISAVFTTEFLDM